MNSCHFYYLVSIASNPIYINSQPISDIQYFIERSVSSQYIDYQGKRFQSISLPLESQKTNNEINNSFIHYKITLIEYMLTFARIFFKYGLRRVKTMG